MHDFLNHLVQTIVAGGIELILAIALVAWIIATSIFKLLMYHFISKPIAKQFNKKYPKKDIFPDMFML